MRWVHSGDSIHKNVTVARNFKGVKVFLLYPSKLFERKWKCSSLSCVQLFVTSWTAACQASLSMEFSRQEHWSRLPLPSQGRLPNPGIEPQSPVLNTDSFWAILLIGFTYIKKKLFTYFWLQWVFIAVFKLSRVAGSGDSSLLWSIGSRTWAQ